MASLKRDTTGPAQHAPVGDGSEAIDPFMVFEKPFDDAKNPPDPTSYPKDLDTTTLLEHTYHGDPPHKLEEREGGRPWPKKYGSFKASKHGRESHHSPGTKSSITNATPLQRWEDEPAVQGPYHGIDGVVMGDPANKGRKGKKEAIKELRSGHADKAFIHAF